MDIIPDELRIEIHAFIGKAVSGCSYLEHLVSLFLAIHYTSTDKKLHEPLMEEVFENDFFSFELKKRIFYKVLKERYHAVYESFPRKELEELQELRNLLAHAKIVGEIQKNEKTGKAEIVVFLRHKSKQHSITESQERYKRLVDVVSPVLKNLPQLKVTTVSGVGENIKS